MPTKQMQLAVAAFAWKEIELCPMNIPDRKVSRKRRDLTQSASDMHPERYVLLVCQLSVLDICPTAYQMFLSQASQQWPPAAQIDDSWTMHSMNQ